MFLTFEQQNDLVNRGLAKRSDNGNLSTFKYARKVMYDYLWDRHPELLECRGHTYDNITGQLIVAAPRKTFNYLENGTWSDKPLDTKVSAYKKYNGFMACLVSYNNTSVISTTGSTKSEYAKLAESLIMSDDTNLYAHSIAHELFGLRRALNKPTCTYLFEIISVSDPHIVNEKYDEAILIGRRLLNGVFYPESGYPAHRTRNYEITTLRDAVELCKTDRGEGFMLYDEQGNCCKIKTEYYVGKKKLMRMPKSKVEQMWKNPKQVQDSLPEYWDNVVEYLLSTQNCSEWVAMTDQQRRKELEKFV